MNVAWTIWNWEKCNVELMTTMRPKHQKLSGPGNHNDIVVMIDDRGYLRGGLGRAKLFSWEGIFISIVKDVSFSALTKRTP